MRWYALASLVLAVGLAHFSARAEEVNLPPGWRQHGEVWSLNGTIRYLNIEGGCWAIDIGGRKLQPAELPPSFRVDGLQISARVRAENDMTTYCAFGQIVTVLEIKKR